MNTQIAIIGAGNMGGAIARGLSKGTLIQSKNIRVSDVSQANLDAVTAFNPEIVVSNSNREIVKNADIVILAIPFKHLAGTLETLHGFEGKTVISPVNPMEKRDFFITVPPEDGSAALMIKRLLPSDAKICTAFNTIAANKWKALDEELAYSVPVCGDDASAKHEVMGIVNKVSKLHAFDAGPLAASSLVESLTPLLLNIARYNKMHDVGIQFH